jgi:hypothetical protein
MVGATPPVRAKARRIKPRALHWRLAANLTGALLRLVPRRLRYPLALRVARLGAPLLRKTRLYGSRLSLHDGAAEESLRLVLRAMMRLGVTFDPRIEIEGLELLPPGPTIFVSGHFMLNILLSRWLHDRGERVTIIHWRPPPGMTVIGTDVAIDALDTTPNVLLQVRSRLAAGGKVAADVDNPASDTGEALELPNGTVYVSDRLFRLAERLDVPVRFFWTRIVDGRVRIMFVTPASAEATAMEREFREFYRKAASELAEP